jgi:hypothetical protein
MADELIIHKIFVVRGQKVMLDEDLADIYHVTTDNLNKVVARNINRFPEDFSFRLTGEEFKNLLFQNGITSWGGRRRALFQGNISGLRLTGINRKITCQEQ